MTSGHEKQHRLVLGALTGEPRAFSKSRMVMRGGSTLSARLLSAKYCSVSSRAPGSLGEHGTKLPAGQAGAAQRGVAAAGTGPVLAPRVAGTWQTAWHCQGPKPGKSQPLKSYAAMQMCQLQGSASPRLIANPHTIGQLPEMRGFSKQADRLHQDVLHNHAAIAAAEPVSAPAQLLEVSLCADQVHPRSTWFCAE
jgi:hypothetical protein